MAKGMSTYEFIVAQREEERVKKEQEEKEKKIGGESQKVVYPSNLVGSRPDLEQNSELSL